MRPVMALSRGTVSRCDPQQGAHTAYLSGPHPGAIGWSSLHSISRVRRQRPTYHTSCFRMHSESGSADAVGVHINRPFLSIDKNSNLCSFESYIIVGVDTWETETIFMYAAIAGMSWPHRHREDQGNASIVRGRTSHDTLVSQNCQQTDRLRTAAKSVRTPEYPTIIILTDSTGYCTTQFAHLRTTCFTAD